MASHEIASASATPVTGDKRPNDAEASSDRPTKAKTPAQKPTFHAVLVAKPSSNNITQRKSDSELQDTITQLSDEVKSLQNQSQDVVTKLSEENKALKKAIKKSKKSRAQLEKSVGELSGGIESLKRQLQAQVSGRPSRIVTSEASTALVNDQAHEESSGDDEAGQSDTEDQSEDEETNNGKSTGRFSLEDGCVHFAPSVSVGTNGQPLVGEGWLNLERRYTHLKLPEMDGFSKESILSDEEYGKICHWHPARRASPHKRLLNEYAAMMYASSNFNVPLVEAAYYHSGERTQNPSICSKFVEGVSPYALESASDRAEVVRQMKSYAEELAEETEEYMRSFVDQLCIAGKYAGAAWEAQACHAQDKIVQAREGGGGAMGTSESFSLRHGDLTASNIIVDPQTIRIKAVLDWEFAGYYPMEFEPEVGSVKIGGLSAEAFIRDGYTPAGLEEEEA